jgi:hypothetical protein
VNRFQHNDHDGEDSAQADQVVHVHSTMRLFMNPFAMIYSDARVGARILF